MSDAHATIARLTEALEFYANPEIYKPHPHGPAFGRRDLSSTAKAALAKSGVGSIPGNLYWLLGKGRNSPTEPLYGVQLLDPETRVVVAEAEAETLSEAIAAAVEKVRL